MKITLGLTIYRDTHYIRKQSPGASKSYYLNKFKLRISNSIHQDFKL